MKSLFVVLHKNGNLLLEDTAMFSGINTILRFDSDSILVFTMSNRQNLTADHVVRIRDGALTDRSGNVPGAQNRNAQVVVLGADLPEPELIGKGANSNCGGCGTGRGLALLPPFYLKASGWRRRRRQKTLTQ